MTTPSLSNIDEQDGTFFHAYRSLNGYDEMVEADGRLREHWQTFAHALENLGAAEFRERWKEAKDLIRENGVTYNVYGDPRGLDRPWQLDPLPVLIGMAEVNALEGGLVQRARLLEAILADLYGPQALLKEGLLPAELVFGNPGFLRPLPWPAPARQSLSPPRGHGLGPRRGRRHACPGRSHAGAVRGRLCPRKPHRLRPHAAGCFSRLPRAAAGPLFSHAARHLALARPAQSRQPAYGAAHAGAVQRDLFRARLPGPLSWLYPRRRRGSHHPRQQGFSQASRWLATGRCHPAPPRR